MSELPSLPTLPVAGQENAGPVLGIDLGTTNTLVAVWQDDRPRILAGPDGAALIPSVVSFPAEGQPVVGRQALERARLDPRRTVHSAKRLLGKGLKDLERETAALPYRLVEEGERKVARIESEGLTEVGEIYKMFKEHEELRIFLDHLRSLESIIKNRTEIFLDTDIQPFNLWNDETRINNPMPVDSQ